MRFLLIEALLLKAGESQSVVDSLCDVGVEELSKAADPDLPIDVMSADEFYAVICAIRADHQWSLKAQREAFIDELEAMAEKWGPT